MCGRLPPPCEARRAVYGEHHVAVGSVSRRGARGVEVGHDELVECALVLHMPVFGGGEELVHPARHRAEGATDGGGGWD